MIFLSNDDDAFIFFGVLIDDFGGIVGGAVIYENDFEIGVGLVYDGVKAFSEIFGGVINGDDNGDFRVRVKNGSIVRFSDGEFRIAKNELVIEDEI